MRIFKVLTPSKSLDIDTIHTCYRYGNEIVKAAPSVGSCQGKITCHLGQSGRNECHWHPRFFFTMSAEDVAEALELLRSFSVFVNVEFCAIGVSLCTTAATISYFRRLLPEPRRKKLPFLLLSIVLSGLYVINGVLDSYIVNTYLAFWASKVDVDEAALYALGTPSAVSSIVQTVASALANCTMIYRCYCLYSDRIWVLVVPILMECASIALGLFMAAGDISTTELNLDNHEASSIVASWFFLTISVDVIVTGLIVLKIVLVQRRTANNVRDVTNSPGIMNNSKPRMWAGNGRKRSPHNGAYMGIVGILVESSLPMAVMGIIAGVVRLTDQNWILIYVAQALWFALYTLCPQLMIFRLMRERALEVNHGSGYTSGSGAPISQPLAFAQNTTQESIRVEELHKP